MLEIKLPSDINAYKSKLIFGFSVRQVVSLGTAIITCVPIAINGKKYMSEDVLSWVVIGIALPILAFGFVTWKDMRFEDFCKALWNHNMNPQKRIYEDTDCNIFHKINEEINEISIVEQKVNNGSLETIRKEWSEE